MALLMIPQNLSVEPPIPTEPKVIVQQPMTVKTEVKEIVIAKKEPQYVDIRVSYYTNSYADCGKTDGITASGKDLKTLSRGGSINDITYIAVPKDIPFGTRYYIEGIGICEAVDTGGAIKWHGDTMWVDVYVPHATAKELNKKGVMKTKGYILK